MKQKHFNSSQEWREWLARNHGKEREIWVIFYKKDSGKPSMDYESAVEEALCFGWIDSIIRKIDDITYVRKFTPREDKSRWSKTNRNRAEKLISRNRMTDIGLAKIMTAKRNELWDAPVRPEISFDLPDDFTQALMKNKSAQDYFEQLAPTYQKQFIGWITAAKRPQTKEKRIEESIRLLNKGQKLGVR
jgi:uncharacterized protein YdeI (YjbR/CyaY-like superfamily)